MSDKSTLFQIKEDKEEHLHDHFFPLSTLHSLSNISMNCTFRRTARRTKHVIYTSHQRVPAQQGETLRVLNCIKQIHLGPLMHERLITGYWRRWWRVSLIIYTTAFKRSPKHGVQVKSAGLYQRRKVGLNSTQTGSHATVKTLHETQRGSSTRNQSCY